jgi:hypothetical protein
VMCERPMKMLKTLVGKWWQKGPLMEGDSEDYHHYLQCQGQAHASSQARAPVLRIADGTTHRRGWFVTSSYSPNHSSVWLENT